MADASDRVVVVSQQYPPDRSGNASRIRDTCAHLADEGWDVTVLAPPPAFPHGQFDRTWTRRSTDRIDGVTVHRLWAWQPTATDPSFLSRMAYYLLFPFHALLWLAVHLRGYDAVVTSSPPIFTGIVGLPIGLLGLRPWIVDVRDLWIDAAVGLEFIADGGLVERASRQYERLVLRTADRITVTTSVLGDRLVDRYGVDGSAVRHVPNGVDTDTYRPTDADREPTIVYAGNVGHAQALDTCVRAMASVETPEATLRIVGDGDVTDRLRRLAADVGVADRVEFTGLLPRESIPAELDAAMVGVAPLKPDPTLAYAVPTKAYEYMSCELPVVATGVGEIESLMRTSGGGVLVDDDADELAAAFDALLSDPDRRRRLGASGRAHVIERYDRGVVARTVSGILAEVTDG